MDTLSINGMDCTCAARSEYECGCDADWTTQEVHDLREEVKQLREHIASIFFTDVDTPQVTRFEVIDHTSTGTGRELVKYGVSVSLGYQDDGTTLKVFLKDGGV